MKIMVTAAALICAIGLLISVAVFTLVPYFYKDDLGKVSIAGPQWVLLFLVLTLFIKMLSQPLGGLWTGIGKPSVSGNAANICSIGELGLSIAVPLVGGGGMALALCLTAVNLIWLLWLFGKSVSIMREHRMVLVGPDWTIGKKMAFSGLGHQVGPLWQSILFQGSIILANSTLGPVGAATWGALRFLTRSGNQVLELVSQTLGPEFQIAVGKGDTFQLREFFSAGLVASLAFSSVVAAGIILIGPYFFKHWAHGTMPVPIAIWLLMATALIPFSFWWLAGEFQRATNRPWQLNLWGILAAAVSVGLMWVFSAQGLISFAIGSLVFELLMAAFILPIVLKRLDRGFLGILSDGIRLISAGPRAKRRSKLHN